MTFAWTDGVSRICLSGTEMRIRWTPEPLAEETRNSPVWRELWPEFRFLEPPKESARTANEVPLRFPWDEGQALVDLIAIDTAGS